MKLEAEFGYALLGADIVVFIVVALAAILVIELNKFGFISEQKFIALNSVIVAISLGVIPPLMIVAFTFILSNS